MLAGGLAGPLERPVSWLNAALHLLAERGEAGGGGLESVDFRGGRPVPLGKTD